MTVLCFFLKYKAAEYVCSSPKRTSNSSKRRFINCINLICFVTTVVMPFARSLDRDLIDFCETRQFRTVGSDWHCQFVKPSCLYQHLVTH